MGNQLSAPPRVQPGELLASDVPNLVYKDSLGGGRFLKTFLVRHDEPGTSGGGGLVVVKAYLKRGSPDALSREEIETHAKNLRTSRERLLSPPPTLPHCAPFARELETDRALYLMRQYAHGTLYDRLFTRPFLSRVQKKWIAFQLLHALSECHERGVVHGDVKCENVLLTSRGWAFLADFATFKPGSLPADNPADYSYYFDTGGRRRCYVAPERFRDGGGDRTGGGATPAADVFSLGCVFGELFLDGAATFDYSQLLAYRRGEFDLRAALAPVGDDDVVDMIAEMCARDPAARPSAKACLDARSKRGGFFPAYFDALHDFCGGLLTADADEAAAEVRRAFDPLMAAIVEEEWRKDGGGGETASRATPSPRSVAPSLKEFDGGGDGGEDDDEEKESSMAGLMADISNLAVTSDAGGGGDGGDDLFAASRSVDSPSASASSSSRAGAGASPLDAVAAAGATCPGAALVASLVCATLRGASSPSARRALLKLLARVAAVADDDARLQVIVPHAIDRVGDTAAVVRAAAVKTLASTLPRVRSHPASDAKVFPEFIWPSLSGLARDREESVRVAYAAALAALASASERFLRRGGGGGGSGDEEAAAAEVASFEDDLAGLRDVVRGIVLDYLTPDGAPGDDRNDAAAAAAAAPVRAAPGSRRPPPPAPPPPAPAPPPPPPPVVGGSGRADGPSTRAALLSDAPALASFFGRADANDFLLPLLITCLNDRAWSLRATFFRRIASVASFVGREPCEAFLLPCIERCLSDASDVVVARALECLGDLVAPPEEASVDENVPPGSVAFAASSAPPMILQKRSIVAAVKRAAPATLHPCASVRVAATRFVARACRRLGPADVFASVLPHATPFLSENFAKCPGPALSGLLADESTLRAALRTPPRRRAFDAAVDAAAGIYRGETATPSDDDDASMDPEAAREERRALAALATYVQSFAGARRAKDAETPASIVCGGLTREAVAAAARGGGGGGGGADLGGSADARGSTNPLDGMMSMNPLNLHDPSSRGLDAAAATPNDDGGAFSYASPGGLGGFGAAGSGMQFSSFFEDAASASAGGGGDAKSAGAGGGGAELIDDDAWAAVFGPRSPPLVPPGARAAPPPVGHPYGGGGAATAKEAPSAAKGHARTSSGADFVAEENGEDKPSIVAGEYASGTTGDAWTPRGVLVAHLTEHRGAVNAVAASDDGAFFVTGSDDGCLKAWDVANAERDAFFRSRATYGGHRAGASASASASDAACKITAAAALSDDGHTICSTADDGSVHAWRVELAAGSGSGSGSGPPGSRPASASEVARASPNEGACSAVIKLSANVACVATERGGLRGWDLRAPLRGDRDRGRGTLGNAFAVDVPPRLGAVTCVVAEAGASPRWTCHGTSAGALCLVDARFGLSVAEWRHPHGAYSRVDAIALGVDGVGAGHKNDAALVWAAAGGDELALWDVGVGACRRVARVLRPPSETTARTMPSSLRRGGRLTRAAATCGDPRAWAKAKAGGGGGVEGGGGGGGDEDGMLDFRVDDLKEMTGAPRSEGARCLFSLPNGALLAGGGDACVRLWCPLEPARGRVVHGPLGRNDRPKHEEVYASNLPVAQERPSASAEAAAAGAGLRAGGDGGVAEAIASAAGRHDCHRDAVLAMCVTGFGTGRVLVTGGRDAAVKVWK